jgi:hypothetical protein
MKILNDSPAYSVSEGLVLRSPGVYLKASIELASSGLSMELTLSRTSGSSITLQWRLHLGDVPHNHW